MISKRRKIDLALLQLEQYDTSSYLAKRKDVKSEIADRLRMTFRIKITNILANIFGIAVANIMIEAVVRLGEKLVWIWAKNRIAYLKSKGLKVIAIAGSYGKTSVKHYSYEFLRHKYHVVATPESFNTVLGIAKCLYYEVDQFTQVFVVELGAYHMGDITYLLRMVQPDLGVLTGIARQHLTRFGSFENIKKAKGEIGEYMKNTGGKLVANGSDPTVREIVEKLGVNVVWYGEGQDRNEINLDAGKKIAAHYGVKSFNARIRPVKNRFEMTTERYGMAVIDDSFSSNDYGFISAIKYLERQKKYTRILVTPGLVELGEESNKIHFELGRQIVGRADYVILVGHNERTKNLEKGIAGKIRIIYIDKTLDFMGVVKSLNLKRKPLVLLENDVTENY